MSLRLRLFLLFGGLAAALVLAQWWLVRSLTSDLSAELGEVALSVGRELVAGGLPRLPGPEGGKDPGNDSVVPTREERRFVVRHERIVVAPGEDAAIPPPPETPGVPSARRGEADVRVLRLHPDAKGAHAERHVAVVGGPHEGGTAYTFEWVIAEQDGKGFLRVGGPGFERMVPIPERGVHQSVERLFRRFVLGSAGIFALGLLAAGVVAHRVAAPLRKLASAARQVGAGDLGAQAPPGPGGEVGEAIASFNRMSVHLKRLDEDARALRARQHLTELGEMARGLAHTLRNPLNALGLTLEELAERLPPGEAPALSAGRRQIERVYRSIRSFLAFASREGGRVSEVDLAALVQDVALEALQDARGRVRLGPGDLPTPCALPGIEPELRAVVQALVVNAIEASPDGGAVRIAIEPLAEGRVRLSVEDNGPGVPPEVRARLFTPHVTTKPSGSGMGLFLAHRIVTTRYDGALELRDREGGGTVARLEIGSRRGGADA